MSDNIQGQDDMLEVPDGTSEPSEDTTNNGQPKEYFFSYKHSDGKEDKYQTKEDLEKGYKDSYFRQSDYSRKTKEHADKVKDFETNSKKREEELNKVAEEYKSFQNFIKTRPSVYQKWKKELQTPAGVQDTQSMVEKIFEEKYGKKLADLEKAEKDRQAEMQKESAYKDLRSRYEGFDENIVTEGFNQLANGSIRELFELIWLAHQGKENPLKTEQRILHNMEKKNGASLLSKGNAAGKKPPSYRNIDEARIAAYKAEQLI